MAPKLTRVDIDQYAKKLDELREIRRISNKEIERITDFLKETNKSHFGGNKFTISRKETSANIFDKEKFISSYGIKLYNKFLKIINRIEFIVSEK